MCWLSVEEEEGGGRNQGSGIFWGEVEIRLLQFRNVTTTAFASNSGNSGCDCLQNSEGTNATYIFWKSVEVESISCVLFSGQPGQQLGVAIYRPITRSNQHLPDGGRVCGAKPGLVFF